METLPAPSPRHQKTREENDPGRFLSIQTEDKASTSDDGPEMILCRFCGLPVTHPKERFEMQGSHRHVFANPHGHVFQIRCFRSAGGCRPVGAPVNEFTWFSGFYWQAAICRGCGEHLGWRFSSMNMSFYGLIAGHLLETPGKSA